MISIFQFASNLLGSAMTDACKPAANCQTPKLLWTEQNEREGHAALHMAARKVKGMKRKKEIKYQFPSNKFEFAHFLMNVQLEKK